MLQISPVHCYRSICIQREGETDRQTETDRDRQRQTETETERETERQRHRERDRETCVRVYNASLSGLDFCGLNSVASNHHCGRFPLGVLIKLTAFCNIAYIERD